MSSVYSGSKMQNIIIVKIKNKHNKKQNQKTIHNKITFRKTKQCFGWLHAAKLLRPRSHRYIIPRENHNKEKKDVIFFIFQSVRQEQQ